ncbi:hypothetical protein SARC_12433 [Sphaeroforma arctica JP610]|uniref:Uncharacterized protein n=1 Tax=Sphaeroforma arctica JP610 TaxID=667725 RepID=A0A0L0FE47_9EUKA|nr:hypothetical protein SARC_12433 [Sphaeroforma arctica JP610]KNC75034.1 hypothetical protein SARC_12433 [Sphaeroforma arctica JP610]|eukprot:XP_014148936.1 hypothetical protein SARC_12433 [Sphaeroforma arctica JP610]
MKFSTVSKVRYMFCLLGVPCMMCLVYLHHVAGSTFQLKELLPIQNTQKEFWPSLGASIPPAIIDYSKFHNEQVQNPQQNTKYLVYTCTHQRSFCGGIGDRLSGIVSLFMLAVSTNRVLVIDWNTPFPLYESLNPNIIDWLTPLKTVILYEIANPEQTVFIEGVRRSINSTYWESVLQRDIGVVRIKSNKIDFSSQNFTHSAAWQAAAGMKAYQFGDGIPPLLCTWILRSLFTPNPTILQIAKDQLSLIGLDMGQPYIAIHTRFGHTANDTGSGQFVDPVRLKVDTIPDFSQCAVTMSEQFSHRGIHLQTSTFLAADSNEGKLAFNAYARDVKYFSAHAFHVDRSIMLETYDSAEGNLLNQLTWVEFLVLSKSECLVSSPSGFSRWAVAISRDPYSGSRCAQVGTQCKSINWSELLD